MLLVRRLLLLALIGVCAPAGGAGPKVHRFTGGEASRFGNAWWFRTERGSVLIDAPFLAAEAAALRAELAEAGALPLGAAILTGPRPETSWGLVPLLSPTTRVWSARSTATTLEAGFHRERERLLREGTSLAEMPRSAPGVTNPFTGSLNLGFEGYTLRLMEAGEAGARRSTVVFVPETGELFAGDLVWNRVHPTTEGFDLGAWRRVLADLKRLGPRLVYPGHGDPGTVELIDRMAEYLGALEEAVRPFAFRSALSPREGSALRRAFARARREWLLPGLLDANLRAEHARLRSALAGGE